MRKLRDLLIVAAIGLAAGGSSAALAQTDARPGPSPRLATRPGIHDTARPRARAGGPEADLRGQRLERLADRLGLSDAQRASIRKLWTEGQQDRLTARKELMRVRNELRGEMLKDNPDTRRVEGLSQQIGDLQTRMRTSRLTMRIQIRKVLTPEQRDQLMLMRMHRGFGRGAGDGRAGAWMHGSRDGGRHFRERGGWRGQAGSDSDAGI